jgi:hypothetical protein
MNGFLHRGGRSPCGASASYMLEKENPPVNKYLLLLVRPLYDLVLPLVPQNIIRVNCVWGKQGSGVP